MTSQGSRFPKNIFSKQFYGRLCKLKKFIDFTKGIFTPGRTLYVYDCRYLCKGGTKGNRLSG